MSPEIGPSLNDAIRAAVTSMHPAATVPGHMQWAFEVPAGDDKNYPWRNISTPDTSQPYFLDQI